MMCFYLAATGRLGWSGGGTSTGRSYEHLTEPCRYAIHCSSEEESQCRDKQQRREYSRETD